MPYGGWLIWTSAKNRPQGDPRGTRCQDPGRRLRPGVPPTFERHTDDWRALEGGITQRTSEVAALWNRSAGSFSSAFLMAASTFPGMEARASVGAGASPVRIFTSTAWAVAPGVGRLPDQHLVEHAARE